MERKDLIGEHSAIIFFDALLIINQLIERTAGVSLTAARGSDVVMILSVQQLHKIPGELSLPVAPGSNVLVEPCLVGLVVSHAVDQREYCKASVLSWLLKAVA